MYRNCMKRCLDFLLSLCGLILLSPVLLILAVLVRVKLGSPVLFKQDEKGNLLPDAVRLTKFGKFLRGTSLDELPELLNILKGDMSIVGPRPLLVSYLPYYSERERLRHSVRPGLTGLAQVSGRNYIDWDRRLAKDVEYVENLSFRMDMKVLWMTVQTVLGHTEEVAQDTNAVEGNFAEIRRKRIEEEKLKKG